MAEQDRFDRIERSIERGIERLDGKIEKMQEDVSTLRVDVAEIKGSLPHLATKEAVEEAKHEATKGKYSMLVSLIAVAFAALSLAVRLWV